ncbi:MAG: hypothetical protein KDB07_03985, partial [Planctomycetes bacterium]|nr:hypothetical protein [Planctomycetota bacterium]
MVEYALSRYFGERPPTVDDVAHCIEQALRSLPGLNEVADAYVESRRRRQELAAIEDGIIFDAEGPKVASRSDYSLHGWDRARLEAALVREHGLPLTSAQAIAGVVEMQVRALDLDEVSTSLLRELVDAQLAKHGVLAGDFGIGQLSLPTWDIEQAIFPQEDTLSDSALGTPRELERFIAQAVMRQFSWRRIHHAGVREATLDAKIAFADSGQPQRFFRLALDTRTLFEENAGVSGLPFFGERVATLPDAVERVAQVLALAVEHAAHEVVLLSFDSAFAPLIRNRADLTNLVPTVRERLSDLAQSGVQVALAFDALAGRMDRAGSIDLLNSWLRESVDAVEAARTNIETRIAIGDASADDPLAIAALSLAIDVTLLGRPLLFRFERAGRSTRRRSLFGESIKSVRSVEVVSSFATLNVIAPLLSGEGWEESALLNSLATSLETLMEGLSEREGFVRRFHLRRRDAMPSPSEALGRHWANSSGIVEIGLVGLYEYARALAPNSEPTSEGFRAVIDRLLGFLKLRLDELAEELGIEARFVGLKEG